MTRIQANPAPRYNEIDFTPSEEMTREVEQGLDWWRKLDGRGGNEMALARAWRIRRRRPLSPDLVRRMAVHMGRLEERKTQRGWNEGEADYPSYSRVTWSLMGGNAGFAWARALVTQLDAADVVQPNVRGGGLVANAVAGREMDGRAYVVAPVVALVPGVVNGFLVTAETLMQDVEAWNGRPVTLRHPQVDGRYVGADDPAARHRIGTLHNAAFADGRLRGELWLDAALCAEVGAEALDVLHALAAGRTFEVSTGYFCQVLDRSGVWEGRPYDGEQVHIAPDHLAVLPDEVGACSWADGCGAPRVNVAQAVPEPALEPALEMAPETELAVQAARTDAMIAFMLREQGVRFSEHVGAWPAGSQLTPREEYHVTLAYLGEIADLPAGVDYTVLARTVAEFARHQPALHGVVSGVGRFSAGSDGTEPVYLSVDSADLQAMRAELVAFLHATGVPRRSEHGFTPHITLGYVPAGAALDLSAPGPAPLAIDAIALAWGGNVTVFPLQGEVYQPDALAAVNQCMCKEEGMEEETQEMAVMEPVQEAVQDAVPEPVPEAPAWQTAVQGEAIAEVERTPSQAEQLVTAFGGVEAVRGMLEQLQTNVRAERDEMVGRLVAHGGCAFSQEDLHAMPLDTLRKLDRSLRPSDYSLRSAVNSVQPEAVTLYGQTWTPYAGPAPDSQHN